VNLELTAVQLDFPNSECTGVVAFRRNVPKTQSIARLLVEALLQGPAADERAAGVTSPFPRGSAVRSVNLRDGVLTVDFNERLQNVGGACRADMIRTAVTRTLKRLPSVREVVITAAGSRELALQP
jgi:spore germination protein GerM